jgi:hypothetical protein
VAKLFKQPNTVLDTERLRNAILLAGGEVGAASESSGELRLGHASGGGDFVILTASDLYFQAQIYKHDGLRLLVVVGGTFKKGTRAADDGY